MNVVLIFTETQTSSSHRQNRWFFLLCWCGKSWYVQISWAEKYSMVQRFYGRRRLYVHTIHVSANLYPGEALAYIFLQGCPGVHLFVPLYLTAKFLLCFGVFLRIKNSNSIQAVCFENILWFIIIVGLCIFSEKSDLFIVIIIIIIINNKDVNLECLSCHNFMLTSN